MYKVLSYFVDLQDNNTPYQKGDTYPRKGYVPTDERIKELSTSANKRGVPLIAEINVKKPVEAVKEENPVNVQEEFMNPPEEAVNDEKPVKRTRKGKKNA